MNRAQRRRLLRGGFCGGAPEPGYTLPCPAPHKTDGRPDFSDVPLATLCQGIRLLLNELRDRGCPAYDFDHKERSVQSIQIIRGKVYFMAAAEEAADGKAQAGNED